MPTIVTNPTAGDVHVDVPLTNFSQKYLQDQDMFVATRAFPNLPVAKQSDLYYEFDRDDFFRDEAQLRADGTESQGSGFKISTDSYRADVWALHHDLTDRQRDNEDSPIQLEQSTAQFIMHKMLIKREREFQDAYFKTGVWATDDTNKNWASNTSDPIIDIRTAKRTVQQQTGFRPNKLLLSRQSYDTLLDNDALIARITGGANNINPAMVQRQLVAQLLEVEEILVMDSIYTSTPENAANTNPTRSFIGGDNALLYYAPASVGLNTPSAGTQFSWTGFRGATTNGFRMKRFRIEQNEADRFEGQMAFDYKVTGADLGYFFSGVSS